MIAMSGPACNVLGCGGCSGVAESHEFQCQEKQQKDPTTTTKKKMNSQPFLGIQSDARFSDLSLDRFRTFIPTERSFRLP